METVDGYQHQYPQMPIVLYSQIAQQQREKQLFNVRLGAALAFLTELPVYQNHNVPHTKPK